MIKQKTTWILAAIVMIWAVPSGPVARIPRAALSSGICIVEVRKEQVIRKEARVLAPRPLDRHYGALPDSPFISQRSVESLYQRPPPAASSLI